MVEFKVCGPTPHSITDHEATKRPECMKLGSLAHIHAIIIFLTLYDFLPYFECVSDPLGRFPLSFAILGLPQMLIIYI